MFSYIYQPLNEVAEMRILFNKKSLEHNIGSEQEGEYRIHGFFNYYNDVDPEYGLELVKLVHPQEYIDKVKNACFNNEKIAEIVVEDKRPSKTVFQRSVNNVLKLSFAFGDSNVALIFKRLNDG